MDAFKEGFLGDKLRRLIDTWPIVVGALKLRSFDSIYVVERAFLEEKCVLFLDDENSGLWRPADPTAMEELLYDLGTSNYAHNFVNGKNDVPGRWANWRVTSDDFDEIIAHVHAIATRYPSAGTPHHRNEHYPLELRAAIEAFEAVHGNPAATAKRTPKAAITAWLKSNRPELSSNAIDRVSIVANWRPTGGAPKTAGE